MQPGFKRTGGLHATGLFDSRAALVCVREDVGRHNAMDKVIGWALQNGGCRSRAACCASAAGCPSSSSRRRVVAGAPVLVGVGAPTSLAVSLAREYGLTLGGFARGERINIYSGGDRLPRSPGPDAGSTKHRSGSRPGVAWLRMRARPR